jgi:hypothetical protein
MLGGAIGYLTTLGIGEEIAYIGDINPYKLGMSLAGTGHAIVPPKFLEAYRPAVAIVMHPIYCEESRDDLETLFVQAKPVAVRADLTQERLRVRQRAMVRVLGVSCRIAMHVEVSSDE